MTKTKAAKQRKKAGLVDSDKPLTKNKQQLPVAAIVMDTGMLQLRQAICMLFMLTEIPHEPSSTSVPACLANGDDDAMGRTFSSSEEELLASAFAFLASRTNDPRKVAAICLEESSDHREMTIKIAANHGDLMDVKSVMEGVAQVLRSAHEESMSDLSDLSDRLLETIISGNRNRILCRLQSCHAKWRCNFKKKRIARSPILPQTIELYHRKRTTTWLSTLEQDVSRLEGLSTSLESLNPSDVASTHGLRMIFDLLKVVHRLWLNYDFRALLPSGYLRSMMTKLSRYVSSAHFLTEAVRRHEILAALKVEIVICEPVSQTIYAPSLADLQSFLSRNLSPADSSRFFQRLKDQKAKHSTDLESTIVDRFGGLINAKCTVHAEIQLLVHYEFVSPRFPPRTICSTKKACYLCNLFLLLHGRFRPPSTHGRLYEKWALPKCIRDLKGQKETAFIDVLGRFFQAIIEAMRHTLSSPTKGRFASNESLFLHSLIWQAAIETSQKVAKVFMISSPFRPQSATQSTKGVDDEASNKTWYYPTTTRSSTVSTANTRDTTALRPTKQSCESHCLEVGNSITLDLENPSAAARVRTKGIFLSFARRADSVTPVEDREQAKHQLHATVESLSAEQRLQPPHKALHPTQVDVTTLVPGVNIVLDQYIEGHGVYGFYISHGPDLLFIPAINRNNTSVVSGRPINNWHVPLSIFLPASGRAAIRFRKLSEHLLSSSPLTTSRGAKPEGLQALVEGHRCRTRNALPASYRAFASSSAQQACLCSMYLIRVFTKIKSSKFVPGSITINIRKMSTSSYAAIIIGSGQAGGPLAQAFANAGQRTALIESTHIGGTCVNEGCTPTKTMVASARVAYLARRGADYGVELDTPFKMNMETVRKRKRDIVNSFRGGSEGRIKATSNLDLFMGRAEFTGEKEIEVTMSADGAKKTLSGEKIFINAGCFPTPLAIPGVDQVDVLNSTTIMELNVVPDHLLVIGGGYVGVEFAQMFRRFGAKVTIIQRSNQLLGREDKDVAEAVKDILTEDGLEILFGASAKSIKKSASEQIELTVKLSDGTSKVLEGTHILSAAGRTPTTSSLQPSVAGLELDRHGFIKVSDTLQTNVSNIFALGDIKGGPQFTHISYDDFRIIRHNFITNPEDPPKNTKNRLLPYTVFMDPQLGRIGLSESEAREKYPEEGSIKVAKMPMAYVARALEMDEARGFIKIIVDANSGKILGAAVLGIEGGEVMTMLQMAMMGGVGWKTLQDAVFAHPGLGELLNNVWGFLK